MTNDIFEPLVLAAGSHKAGTGRGCAMNVISWENGDVEITDFPECSDMFLAAQVQSVNDTLADIDTGLLSPADSLTALELGHMTVGTNLGHYFPGYREVLYKAIEPIVNRAIELVTAHAYDGSDNDLDALLTDMEYLAEATGMASIRCQAAIVLVQVTASTRAALWPVPDDWERTWRPAMVREVIAEFKKAAGVVSPLIDPRVTAQAVECMRQVVA